MAEAAVGLAASIGGLVCIALKVSKLCYNHYGEVMNAQEDIKQLATEISSLSRLLEPLSEPSEASKISQALDSDSDSISELVRQCTEMLAELQCKLQHLADTGRQPHSKTQRFLSFLGASKGSLKWPFKKEGTLERIQKIERLKSAVALKLQM